MNDSLASVVHIIRKRKDKKQKPIFRGGFPPTISKVRDRRKKRGNPAIALLNGNTADVQLLFLYLPTLFLSIIIFVSFSFLAGGESMTCL